MAGCCPLHSLQFSTCRGTRSRTQKEARNSIWAGSGGLTAIGPPKKLRRASRCFFRPSKTVG
eukprot:1358679-Rhodomonas_salina.3